MPGLEVWGGGQGSGVWLPSQAPSKYSHRLQDLLSPHPTPVQECLPRDKLPSTKHRPRGAQPQAPVRLPSPVRAVGLAAATES